MRERVPYLIERGDRGMGRRKALAMEMLRKCQGCV